MVGIRYLKHFLLAGALLCSAGAYAETDDHNLVFNWAEKEYPQYFSPGSQTQNVSPWVYRYYPQTGVYLGTNQMDEVYVMGGEFGESPVKVGTLSEFMALIDDPDTPQVSEEHWQLGGYLIGRTLQNETSDGSFTMADVIKIDGLYYLYYNIGTPDKHSIAYATSPDGFNWTVQDIIMDGGSDPDSRQFVMGGPSVVALPDGRYRMYFRASPKYDSGEAPEYHILSAISEDGQHFEQEDGVRIDIQPYDEGSMFTLAGHGRFFINNNGRYVSIFSANPEGAPGASDLFLAVSDDGLNWGEFKKLYDDWHDPTIEQTAEGFVMYATYLDQKQGKAVSADGINWPDGMTDIQLTDEQGNILTEGNAGNGDLASMILDNGELLLLSNFGKPSADIVYYRLKE